MATTTNYGWTTPDDTALVKDGASAIRSLGTSVDTTTKNLNPSTTLGDIEYRSSTANTNTRLGIGTTGQILTVSGGVPSWATPAGGGSLTLLSTTTLSGASTTISSISGSYKHLYAYIYAVGSGAGNSGTSKTRVAPNGSTDITNGYYNGTSGNQWSHRLNSYLFISDLSLQGSAPTQNGFALTIYNYSQTNGRKPFTCFGNGYIADTGESYAINGMGAISTTSAITSLVFSNSDYNFRQGTVELYGVN